MCSVGVLPRLFFLYATLLTFFSRTRGPGAYGSSHITHSSDYNKDLLISHPQGRFIHSLKLAVSEVVGIYDWWNIWHDIIITIIQLLFSEFSYRFLMFFDVIFPPVIFLALYYQSAQNLFMNQKTSHSIFKDRLNVVNGFMMYTFEDRAPRLDIPKSLRRQIIMNFHAANQGSTSMLARARDDVYWPNMDNDINNHVSSCSQCRESAPSQQKEPLLMTEAPEYPFQHTVADLF